MSESPLPYGSTPDTTPSCPDTSFEAQYKRLFAAVECRTQTQLAAVLDIRQSSISDAKRRKAVPSDWLVKLFEKQRLNPEWVRTGMGPTRLGYPDTKNTLPHVVKVTEIRPPTECSAQELFTELVRRALEPLDIEAIQKEVAAGWLPVKKADGES